MQTHRVFPNQPRRQIRIPRFQRFDDAHVIHDRPARPILFFHRPTPHRVHMHEQPVSHRFQQFAPGHFQDHLVETDIGLGIFRQIGTGGTFAMPCCVNAQGRNLTIRRQFRRQPRGHAFQRRPGHDHLQNFIQRLAQHKHALARPDFNETFLFQPRQRLAQRRPRHRQLLGQPAFIKPQIRVIFVDIHVDDRLAKTPINMVLQREIHGNR